MFIKQYNRTEGGNMQDKVVVIHQPDFMPYLGFFDRLLKADIYVVFDNVQYVRGSRALTSRDKIKTKNGEKWISVGIQKPLYGSIIKDVLLRQDSEWRETHLNIIRENYRKSVYYYEVMPYIEDLYSFKCKRMMDFNMRSIEMLIELFDIHIEIVIASDLGVAGKSNELIIDIVKKLNCHRYLSGVGARDYYIAELYEEAGIEVIWQDFKHPIYPQQYEGFIPYLSSIDLLFNCGIEKSRKILRGEVNYGYI